MAPIKRPLNISAMRHCKRVCSSVQSSPFLDWQEHDSVGMALLHHNCEVMSTEEALERVSVWKTRSTKLAHAIESTAALAQIIFRDQQQSQLSSSVVSTSELRHAYACVILRSINGLADSLQQQKFAASSVAVLCAELGVPPWLVAVRHESTHNQLPPLPTLRMAAQALVQYFSAVYWEPTKQRHIQQYDLAWSLLCYYESAAIDLELSRMENNIDEEDEEIVNDNSDELDGEDEVLEVDGLLQSPIGTTSNRFAALQETLSKISKAVSPNTAKDDEPAKKKPKMEPSNFTKKSQFVAAGAKKIVMEHIPKDILHRAAIEFLVGRSLEWSRMANNESCNADMFVYRFRLLLSTLGRSWPGFLCAFLLECVHQIVVVESEELNDNSPLSKEILIICSIFESWIHLLLSRKLAQQVVDRNSMKSRRTGSAKVYQKFADLDTLRCLQYPLNRICDNFLGHAVFDNLFHRNQDFVRYRLADVIGSILGDERSPQYGMELPLTRANFRRTSKSKHEQVEPVENAVDVCRTANPAMTLEAMEAYLDETKTENTKQPFPTDKAQCIHKVDDPSESLPHVQAPVWVQCQSWEACAVGSLFHVY